MILLGFLSVSPPARCWMSLVQREKIYDVGRCVTNWSVVAGSVTSGKMGENFSVSFQQALNRTEGCRKVFPFPTETLLVCSSFSSVGLEQLPWWWNCCHFSNVNNDYFCQVILSYFLRFFDSIDVKIFSKIFDTASSGWMWAGSKAQVFRSRLKAAGNWILRRDWKSLSTSSMSHQPSPPPLLSEEELMFSINFIATPTTTPLIMMLMMSSGFCSMDHLHRSGWWAASLVLDGFVHKKGCLNVYCWVFVYWLVFWFEIIITIQRTVSHFLSITLDW